MIGFSCFVFQDMLYLYLSQKMMLKVFGQSLRNLRRGKSMLAQPETAVVFVPDQTISQGSLAVS